MFHNSGVEVNRTADKAHRRDTLGNARQRTLKSMPALSGMEKTMDVLNGRLSLGCVMRGSLASSRKRVMLLGLSWMLLSRVSRPYSSPALTLATAATSLQCHATRSKLIVQQRSEWTLSE